MHTTVDSQYHCCLTTRTPLGSNLHAVAQMRPSLGLLLGPSYFEVFMWPAMVVGQTGDVIILLELHIFMSWPAHVLFISKQRKSQRTLSSMQGLWVPRWKITLWREVEREDGWMYRRRQF